MREINQAGLDLIKSFEKCVLYAYDDADTSNPKRFIQAGDPVRGTLTIGWGHTGTVRRGMTISQQDADFLLAQDLGWARKAVEHWVKVPLNDNQFGSLVSFVFNVGEAAFASSTLLRVLNEGDYNAVPRQMARWDKTTINGKKVQSDGLIRRRAAEIELWTKPVEGEEIEANVHAAPLPDRSPSESLTIKGAVVSGVGAVGTILVDAAQQIQALSGLHEYFQIGAGLLLALGIGLTIYGRLRVMRNEGV